MKLDIDNKSASELVLKVALDNEDLKPLVRHTYNNFRASVKADGFRPGKAPDHIVEAQVGSQHIQEHVIEDAARKFYTLAVKQANARPLGSPKVEVKKFVPFTNLELEFTTDVLGEIKLPDYKNLKKPQAKIKVSDKEINQVIENLRARSGQRQETKSPAKDGDEIVVDMRGQRDGKPVPGTEAKDYAILLGSGRFVPGFEDNLKGLKVGDKKEFEVTFPKDYAEPTLQDKKVKFSINVKKVQKVELPKVDDEFAKSVGPFKTLAELRADIKKQVEIEKTQNERRRLTDEVVDEVVAKTKMAVPKQLVAQQQEQLWTEFEKNVKQQGMEIEDYLKREQKSRQEIESLLAKDANKRVKTALVLSEVANQEKLAVTPDELEIRLQILKGRYSDQQMQAELDKEEVKKDIADQLLIEKTVDKLVAYATK